MFNRRNFAPAIFLTIDGKQADDLLRFLVSFSHKKSLKKAGEAKFTFRNDDMKLMEDPRFLSNVQWRFRYGFFNDLSPIISGEVRQVEPSYEAKRMVTVTVMDETMRLGKSSSGKNWGRVKSSDIAQSLANKYGLVPCIEDSSDVPEQDYIQPANISDLEYLRDLAADLDYELFVDGNPAALVFRKRMYDTPTRMRQLIYYSDPTEFSYVKSFKPKIKSLGAQSSSASKLNAGTGKASNAFDLKAFNLFADKAHVGDGYQFDNNGQWNLQLVDQSNSGATTKYEIDADDLATRKDGKPHGAPVRRGTTQVFTPIGKGVPSSANPAKVAANARQQMLDKAQEATSEHPLTNALTIGKAEMWAGIDKPLCRAWYVTEINSQITATSSGTTVEWKRDDPNSKKKGSGDAINGLRNIAIVASATAGFLTPYESVGEPKIANVDLSGEPTPPTPRRPVPIGGVGTPGFRERTHAGKI